MSPSILQSEDEGNGELRTAENFLAGLQGCAGEPERHGDRLDRILERVPAQFRRRGHEILPADERPELRKVLVNDDVTMYALRVRPEGAVPRAEPGPIGPQVTWTPWSVVGGLAAIALIVLLTAREVVRVAVRPGVRQLRWVQSSFWFSLPLLAVLLASLVQRFLTMK